MELEKQYITYFEQFFKDVRAKFNKSVNYCPDDELSSGELAHKKAIWSLPCSVNIVRLIVNTKKYKEASGRIYHLIAYDFSDLGKTKVNYYGEIDTDDLEKQSWLQSNFKLEQSDVNELKKFKILGYADSENWFYVTVIPYDIFENPQEHAREFISSFSPMFGRAILQKFEETIDFNFKYSLESEPVLSVSELLRKTRHIAVTLSWMDMAMCMRSRSRICKETFAMCC